MPVDITKPRMYVLVGLPYAGKTTLTNELRGRFGFSSVSVDDVTERKGFTAEEMTQGQWDTVYSEAYVALNDLLANGRSVIVDFGNLKRSERDAAKATGDKYGVDARLIYINTPKEDILARWSKNAETKGRGQLSRDLLRRAFDMWEEPTPDENPILFNQTMDLNEWIATNIEGAASGIEQK